MSSKTSVRFAVLSCILVAGCVSARNVPPVADRTAPPPPVESTSGPGATAGSGATVVGGTASEPPGTEGRTPESPAAAASVTGSAAGKASAPVDAATASNDERLPDWPMPKELIRRLVAMGVVTEPQLIAIADAPLDQAPASLSSVDVVTIRNALLRMGYSTIVVQAPPLTQRADLLLEGSPLTSFQPSKKAAEFRRTEKMPIGDDVRLELVALDTVRDGRPMRWQRWIDRRTGTSVTADFSPSMITPLSFSVGASNQVNPRTVYAGDVVRLQCEALPNNTFNEVYWMVFEQAAEVGPDTFSATPVPLATATGLPSMLDLRRRIGSTLGPRKTLFDGPQGVSHVIGSGANIAWKPRFECPSVTIVLLGFDRAGQWSLASRSVEVVDARPAIWMMPETTLQNGSLEDFQPKFPYGRLPKPLDIYAIQDVMDQATFQAVTGAAVAFTLHQTDFRDAQLPPTRVSVDWGDGSPVEQVPAGSFDGRRLTHAYAKSGTFTATVTADDVLSLARAVSCTLRVQDAPAEATETVSEPAAPSEPARLSVSVRGEINSFQLFEEGVRRWAEEIVRKLKGSVGESPVVLAMLPDPGPGRQNYRVAVLKDETVAEAKVADGLQDGGQIAGVADKDLAIVDAVVRGSTNLAELAKQDPNAVARIFGAGRTVAFPAGTPDSNAGDLFMQQLVEASVAGGLALQEREGEWSAAIMGAGGPGEAPQPEKLICFKVKRAGVVHSPIPYFVRREATIYSMVRVYDLKTRTIVNTWTQRDSVSDLVTAYDYKADNSAWDSYPPGFMTTAPAGAAATIVPDAPQAASGN